MRVPEKSPVTAFWMPPAVVGSDVGESKYGTAVSVHAAAANRHAAPINAARPLRPERNTRALVPKSVSLMLETQVEGEEEASGGWVRRDVDSAREVPRADRGNFGIKAIEPLAVPVQEVATEEAESRARNPA